VTTATTVVVVDDQALLRSAFRTILAAAGIDVVGEAADGDGAVTEVERTRPDVVLMDVRMPGRDGISATALLQQRAPATRVLVLTTFDHDEYLDGALRAGAAGFLLKNASPEELVAAIRAVAAGEGVLDPAVVGRVLARLRPGSRPRPKELDALTAREEDVLRLVCEGLTNSEIAERLGLGEATAKTHLSRVLMKLGVRDRVQAVIWAYDNGVVSAPGRSPGS
jgi:DNA-binding NarL/FixJ family response regulator